MFCSKCGKELKENGNFCANCGEPVNKANVTALNLTAIIINLKTIILGYLKQVINSQEFKYLSKLTANAIRFLNKFKYLIIATIVISVSVYSYLDYKDSLTELDEYLQYSKQVPSKVMSGYDELRVREFRDMPGYGGAFGQDAASSVADNIFSEEIARYESLKNKFSYKFISEDVISCAALVNLSTIQQASQLKSYSNSRLIDMKELRADWDQVEKGIIDRFECNNLFKSIYSDSKKDTLSAEKKIPEEVAPIPEPKAEALVTVEPAVVKSDFEVVPKPNVTGKSGEEVYKAGCYMCHEAGLMNAPKFGDKLQWESQIKQGYDTLVKHAIEGIRTMPARGGTPSLTDDEVARAVVHMANASGANFKAPAPKLAKAEVAAAVPAPTTEVKAAEPADTAVTPVAAGKSGEEVYKAVCAMCHATGLMNSPKIGDKTQWEPRIKQGYDTLVTNANMGIRTMPAKGGNPSLSDAEVAGAVKYMANAAGADF